MKTKSTLIVLIVIVILGAFFWYVAHPKPVSNTDNNQPGITATPLPEVAGVKTLHIVSQESQAQFSLNEVLRGKPNLVVGTTDVVAGDIQVIPTNPAKITIGEIKIDASTLKTDNPLRNKSLNTLILKTGENQYITFVPTNISGVPTTIETDKPFTYKITGDLKISGVTKSVTFDATSTLKADGSFAGSAETIVTHGDFGVSVPDLPFLANVDKKTKLSISVVAR